MSDREARARDGGKSIVRPHPPDRRRQAFPGHVPPAEAESGSRPENLLPSDVVIRPVDAGTREYPVLEVEQGVRSPIAAKKEIADPDTPAWRR